MVPIWLVTWARQMTARFRARASAMATLVLWNGASVVQVAPVMAVAGCFRSRTIRLMADLPSIVADSSPFTFSVTKISGR